MLSQKLGLINTRYVYFIAIIRLSILLFLPSVLSLICSTESCTTHEINVYLKLYLLHFNSSPEMSEMIPLPDRFYCLISVNGSDFGRPEAWKNGSTASCEGGVKKILITSSALRKVSGLPDFHIYLHTNCYCALK